MPANRFPVLKISPASLGRWKSSLPQFGEHTGPTRLVEHMNFGTNPGALRMFLYVPPSLPENAPLVVILHGCTQNAAVYDRGAGWSELASRAGFAVLAPEQSRENNVNGCFNWFRAADTTRDGEAASIRQMIERAIASHDLDRGRVFITGLSAGGAMTAAMLGAYPEVFAGGAIIAGLPVGAAGSLPEALNSMRQAPNHSPGEWSARVRRKSNHAGPWPRLSIWHGDADTIVHSSNSDALIAQWTDLHGLGAHATNDVSMDNHRHRTWKDEDGGVLVEAFTIAGAGHGTPFDGSAGNRIGAPGPYFLDVGISSTIRIAAFWGVCENVPPSPNASDEHQEGGPTAAGRIRGVIAKALKSAGLVAKRPRF